ncbi:chaperonin 10-like protein [Elsinoe ampelina]|uniref:Chaperonin 10-like protein n=1 Tax=Elsinoe ampelina TaxID=302913 RepID=A0A6A6G3X5_9PEZI|nr:chaperonin 10-like protein [Elsinoe ampelina]
MSSSELHDGETHFLECFAFDPREKRYTKLSTKRGIGPSDVLIKTTHSGLCYTDVHAKTRGCGLGHEGVGIVEKTGVAVRSLKAGDRVGWGWLHESCGACSSCLSGYRQYCADARGFAFSDLDQGAFGNYRIINAEFAYRIPESISSVDAGPFMCAGASVYEALDAAGTKPSDRVGVVGIGGLGHMAVLFAKAMGCGVTALFASGKPTPQKVKDAFDLGVDEARCIAGRIDELYTTADGPIEIADGEEPEPDKKINVLLVCSNELPDWFNVLPLLDRMARIVLMTIQTKPLSIPYMPFILPGHRIISSTEASRKNHLEMLEFAARNHVKPWVETFPMSLEGIQAAFQRLETGRMRYRGVLQW